MPAEIRWPDEYLPSRTAVHVRNELAMPVSPAAAWAWLVRAELWPTWYVNASRVRIVGGPLSAGSDLQLGSRFRWRSFGVALDTTVVELVPGERIAWIATSLGVRAYHAWLLSPLSVTTGAGGEQGCHVLTEETQNGWLARLGSALLPHRMSHYHQIWLESLARQAAGGPPPSPRDPAPLGR